MLVSEIFASIQGEGVSAGVPSTFLRLAECNLKCAWCDTKYTWDWDHFDRAAEVHELDEAAVLERIGAAKNVVITGGEPLLQQEALVRVAGALQARGARIEIETSGTIEPVADFADQWNVSPKLESSGNKLTARLRAAPLAWFAARQSAYWKFVIVEPSDLREVEEIVTRFAVPAARVVLMPEGTEPIALQARSGWLADECARRGYRFSTRLHVLLWGGKRGT